MKDLEFKRKILISAIYDIFDNIDLLKMILELSDTPNKKKYFELLDNLDAELNRIIYNLRYELKGIDYYSDNYTTENKLTEEKLKDILDYIQDNY